MTANELLEARRDEILAVAVRHGARNVRVFGSAARGEASPVSDIDLLVDFEPGRTLLDQVALIADLKELLGRDVDVVTEGALHRLLKRRILKESRAL
jgi:predicted nucleotidyltransferase